MESKMEWKLAYAHHDVCCTKEYCTIAEIEGSGFPIIPAAVPGNFELDLMREGLLEDLYYSTNTLKAQELEDVHLWYYTTVEVTDPNQYLEFEGIDTFADIYVNGRLVKSADNMFLPWQVEAKWRMAGAGNVSGEGEWAESVTNRMRGVETHEDSEEPQPLNEIVVHIKPAVLEVRKYPVPVASNSLEYNAPSLYARKAASMYGWDIMPRIVSAGLWKNVTLKTRKPDRINEFFMAVNRVNLEEESAELRFYVNVDMSVVSAKEYTVRVEGTCQNAHFITEKQLWHNSQAWSVHIDEAQFWWPKNAGAQNIYDTTVTLLRKGEICDIYNCKLGIRTVELERTDTTDENGNGKFDFKVNGKPVFAMGTNWVPLDAFHSNDINRLPKALEMLDDLGCNMVRCWGGNVYENDEFYEFCDEHGIMIWQDFGMGCAVYPDDEWFCKALEKEAIFQIKRLRNHPSLVLWAGDNECDLAYESWNGFRRNPNENRLTRQVLKNAVERHDYTRPYLPSSPYVSEAVYAGEGLMPENHLWGPRDYFKGDFYKNTFCHFASETGYHGFNSPKSLERFLKEPARIFEEDGTPTAEYLVHGSGMETKADAPYAYRIRLAYNQVVTLFGEAAGKLDDFVRQSQISQAEAKKYFIEKFRIGKGKRTGILWWNLVDGWPQVSDAIVDYYYVKKLAYHYIKRSQQSVCLMFDEPEDGKIRLVGVNDLPEKAEITYRVTKVDETVPMAQAPGQGAVTDAVAGTIKECTAPGPVVLQGRTCIGGDAVASIDLLPIAEGEKVFYLIEWEYKGQSYKNHYFTNIIDINYEKYMCALKKCSMDEFEGF